MLPTTPGRLQFSGATKDVAVSKNLGLAIAGCTKACADDATCGGMTVGPDGKGGYKCVVAEKDVARSAQLLAEDRWASALKAARGNEVGPSRDKFTFDKNVKAIGGKDLSSDKSTDDLLRDCTAECDKDWRCRVATVYNPKKGKGECKLYGADALPSLKREPASDGRSAGSVFAEKPAPPPKGERFVFDRKAKPIGGKSLSSKDSTAELLKACRDECAKKSGCRVATVYNAKTGKGKCDLWDAKALETLAREPDDTGRYGGDVLPEPPKPPPKEPAPQKPKAEPLDFKAYKTVQLQRGKKSNPELLRECRAACVKDRNKKARCMVAAISEQKPSTCLLGDESQIAGLRPEAPEGWLREIVNPEDPAAPPPLTPMPSQPKHETPTPVVRPAPQETAPVPTAAADDGTGWFTGTGWFEKTSHAGTGASYVPYTGDLNAGAGGIGKVPYEIAPADMMEPTHAIVRKGTLSGKQSSVLLVFAMLMALVGLWCFVFFLQSMGITAERVKDAYASVKAALPMGRGATVAALRSA